jgi:sulfur-oxidizing protein SoxY
MLTRRDTMALGAGAAAFGMLPAMAHALTHDEALAAFTGGAAVTEGGVTISAPEIAENGNSVPIMVEAAGAVALLMLATKNPTPGLATFTFGEGSGSSRAATRIRLGTTQDVVAVARMADGTFRRASVEVKVTIGGCGG